MGGCGVGLALMDVNAVERDRQQKLAITLSEMQITGPPRSWRVVPNLGIINEIVMIGRQVLS